MAASPEDMFDRFRDVLAKRAEEYVERGQSHDVMKDSPGYDNFVQTVKALAAIETCRATRRIAERLEEISTSLRSDASLVGGETSKPKDVSPA